MNPYTQALHTTQRHYDTGGAVGLAKCILSLWNENHRFSMAEILRPLDESNTQLVIGMVKIYGDRGETPELLEAGRWVYDNYPGLIEISSAMYDARGEVLRRRDDERERQAEEEDRKDEQRRLDREAKAANLFCIHCGCETKHLPESNGFECQECYTFQVLSNGVAA